MRPTTHHEIERQMDDSIPLTTAAQSPSDLEGRVRVYATLKSDINAFLFVRLPDTMTLQETEALACRVFDLVNAEWSKRGFPNN